MTVSHADHDTPARQTRRPNRHAGYPRAPECFYAGLVGRAEILRLASLDPDSELAKAWWRKLLQAERLPPADGQLIDGKPTWRERTILWWLQDRTNHLNGNRPYLSPEDDARATALAEEDPLAYEAYRRRAGRRAAARGHNRKRPVAGATDPHTQP